ncbi:MAG TPA: extracellular solute-binding protein [Acetobacteraceae bacterium]|jgi:multiple sugar transport system substrate-binding protein|nr:extracellular solute-binding protein [Acetobacteraceae bacterium]
MTKIRRRRALQLSAGSALAATSGGLAGILASGRAPAYAQAQTMHWLRWADFVPSSDVLLKGEITKLCEKDLGMKLTVETINANDIQARITAAIQSGAGPDIFMTLNNWPQLYAESCVDVSELSEEIGSAQGGYYDICKVVGTVKGRWIAVPWCTGGGLVAYRKSWLADAGSPNGFPKTWDEYRAVGKKLKAAGHPYGQTAGHTFGDAPGWWYPYLWSWGGKEVEADGKTVVLNTKETVESVKFAVALWKETMDEGGLAWDDTSNNRAFLSGSISATNNGASIYLEAKKKPDSYQTEKGTPMKDDILHAGIPGGAGGQFNLPGTFNNLVMKYSKNQDAAKKFIRWISSKEIFDKWFVSQQGYTSGATKMWENHPVWSVDPVIEPFKRVPVTGRLLGYAGAPTQKAAEVQTKYIIVDMYAKAIQGMAAEASVKAAHDELVTIYRA